MAWTNTRIRCNHNAGGKLVRDIDTQKPFGFGFSEIQLFSDVIAILSASVALC